MLVVIVVIVDVIVQPPTIVEMLSRVSLVLMTGDHSSSNAGSMLDHSIYA